MSPTRNLRLLMAAATLALTAALAAAASGMAVAMPTAHANAGTARPSGWTYGDGGNVRTCAYISGPGSGSNSGLDS